MPVAIAKTAIQCLTYIISVPDNPINVRESHHERCIFKLIYHLMGLNCAASTNNKYISKDYKSISAIQQPIVLEHHQEPSYLCEENG